MKPLSRYLLPPVALVALGTAMLLYLPRVGQSSDHQDSPLTVGRPGADLTDVFVFPAADPKKVVLAMDVHPLIPAGEAQTASFDPAVMYQFKIATDGGFKETSVIQFHATGTGPDQRIEMYGPTPPAMPGTRSAWVGDSQTMPFNHVTPLSNGVTAFAGPRQDPFYFDLAQFFKIVPDRNYKYHPPYGPGVPAPTAKCFRNPGVDFLRGYNVLSLVVEMPRQMLASPNGKLGIIHVYSTTSLEQNGSWVQVERLGRPAVKEAFEAFENHDATNRSSPWKDTLLAHSIVSFMSSKNGAGRSMQLASAVEHVLIPDELTANLGSGGRAGYLAVETKGKSTLPTAVERVIPNVGLQGLKTSIANKSGNFGGRDPSSPVIGLSLGVIFGSLGAKVGLAPDDMKETACLSSDNVVAGARGHTDTFPYLGAQI